MKKRFFLFLFLFFLLSFFSPQKLQALTADECEAKIGRKELNLVEAKACQQIFADLSQQAGEQKRSLQSEIRRFDNLVKATATKIYVTAKEVKSLEEEIETLSQKIGRLDTSLDQVSQVLIERIAETYKKGRIDPLALFFSSKDFDEFISRYKYLKVIQLHDRSLMVQMETVRTNYADQKNLKEKKQAELEAAKKKLESQKIVLAQQRADKERLLEMTQSREQRYQQLLAATRAEIDAIQRIIAGRGKETKVGEVSQGDIIASIISGASACSTGTHLHFEVREQNRVKNPLSFLKNIVINSPYGDSAVATGSWDWPLSEPITLTQTFGSNTSFIRSGASWYHFHTGIDIVSPNHAVKAVQGGILYRGAIACGSGTLRYVRVDHKGSDLDSYYLHVNY